MTVFKKNLVKRFAEEHGLSEKDAKKYFQGVLDIIVDELLNGNNVKINNFFNFFIKQRKEKRAINPITKEPMLIPSVKTIHVRMSKSVKEAIQSK